MSLQDWSGPVGTCVSAADLFYSVPVRKGFLKSASTEFSHCHDLIQSLALCHPQIGFTLLHNKKEILRVSSQVVSIDSETIGEKSFRKRAIDILGKDLAGKLVYVHKDNKYGMIEALISPPGIEKGSSKFMYTWVNGRWVKDKTLRYGILRGYHSHLLKGKFPIVLMHFLTDPSLVDVNVHPSKTELRFQYGSEVQSFLSISLRESLRKGAWAAPDTPAMPTHDSVKGGASKLPKDFDLTFGSESSPYSSEPKKPASSVSSDFPATPSFMRATAPKTSELGSSEVASGNSKAGGSLGASAADNARPIKGASGNEKSSTTGNPWSPPVRKRVPDSNKELGHRSVKSTELNAGGPGVVRTTVSFDHSDRQTVSRQKQPLDPEAAFKDDLPQSIQKSLGLDKKVESKSDGGDPIPWEELKFVGAFARCYLFYEHFGRLLVLDQHAFHERVLYERLTKDKKQLGRTQPLLVVEAVTMQAGQVARLEEQKETLESFGFKWKKVDETLIEIETVPSLLINKDLESLFLKFADSDFTPKDGLAATQPIHDIFALVACHSAVRAGEELGEDELKFLMNEAKTVDFYHNCPHGRRVFRWLSQSEVGGWFDR